MTTKAKLIAAGPAQRWPRILAWTAGILLVATALMYAVPQVRAALVHWMIAGREAELRQEVEGKLQPQIDQAQKERAAAKTEADECRPRSAALGRQVPHLPNERADLKQQVGKAGTAVGAAREDAARVADMDLLPRIRTVPGRRRAGIGG